MKKARSGRRVRANPVPTVFLSHSHHDKRVARRIARYLAAYGIKVWLDEQQLRAGAALTSSIRSYINTADQLLVIASEASAASKWVRLELEFARKQKKPILPFFVEHVESHVRFREHLGVDATSPQNFANTLYELVRTLFQSVDHNSPPADPAVLKAGLRQLASEEPNVAPLIFGCLESQGLHQENIDTVDQAPFHAYDEALNGLYELMPTETIAYHAAYGFAHVGTGARALFSWIAANGDGGIPLATAVDTKLDSGLIPSAIKLLQSCNPPNNQALYEFIHHNAAYLGQEQRRSVIQLTTWPLREDTSRFADVLGWVAHEAFPEAVEIQQMWIRWIKDGAFDGNSSAPGDLARYLADADKKALPGWDRINQALRDHVRHGLRSCNKDKIVTAMDHIQAAADAGAPVLSTLLQEASGVSGTAEWNEWRKRDPATAEWMQWYVFEFAKEAAGNRNWAQAWEGAQQMVAFEQERRRVLAIDQRKDKIDR